MRDLRHGTRAGEGRNDGGQRRRPRGRLGAVLGCAPTDARADPRSLGQQLPDSAGFPLDDAMRVVVRA
jgi:hypothetical protein